MIVSSLKIAEVVSRLRPRFQPDNYGLNKAINRSKLIFGEKDLSICPPPINVADDHPLPYFTCGTAARLTASHCRQAGLEASEIAIDLPIDKGTGESSASIGHTLCKAGQTIIDLTSPINSFLGTNEPTSFFPYAISSESYPRGLNYSTTLNERYLFRLFQENNLAPLAASLLNENTLAIAHYNVQFIPENNRLVFYLDIKVLFREQKQTIATQFWNAKVLVGVPVHGYPAALDRLLYHANQPNPARSALNDRGLVYYEEMEFPLKNEAYREPTFVLLNKVWPAVTAFFSKVPEAN